MTQSYLPHFIFTLIVFLFSTSDAYSQDSISRVWTADNGDGTYKNPILHADYSDPDAIRVGDDYYMTSSSFEDVPGLPILHSKNLVNWRLIGHALPRLLPEDHFSTTRHGEGVWAPSIRYHKGEFYIYYPDPDFGIYLTKAKNAAGPWSTPILVQGGKGLIDPCPLWDVDGNVYLVHAFAGSRAGIKSILVVKRLSTDGTQVIDNGVIVYDGHQIDPTVEGPKFYKRNGCYYIFAPAGGVTHGWQIVLRSKNIYGPYERKMVMHQGNTVINGPHQGAWVTTQTGEDWFLHFQDKGAYGRVVHLQPMAWKNDWPVIGIDADGDGTGEPVMTYKKPNVGRTFPKATPPKSEEFYGTALGLQWQWMANPKPGSYFLNPSSGSLRLYGQMLPPGQNLWTGGQVLQQKFPAEAFTVTIKMSFHPNQKLQNERAGLVIMGMSYAGLALKSTADGQQLVYLQAKDTQNDGEETEQTIASVKEGQTFYLRVQVSRGALCRFSYSTDGKNFIEAGEIFTAEPGRWKGAKFGIFATRAGETNDAGFVDFDWLRVD
ncbi:MAG: glycoside hydrolase 43 family protein [Flavisolibacter sp.]